MPEEEANAVVGKSEVTVTENFKFLQALGDGVKYAVLEGSTRSTKTYSIIQYLVAQCLQRENLTVRCYRFDAATHATSTIVDFLSILKDQYKIFGRTAWNKTEKRYEFANGSVFKFDGLSDAQKLHGRRQDIVWFEEAMEVPYDSYTQIAFRTTGLQIFSFNPSLSRHWVFDYIIPDGACAYKHSTYKDNPFLTTSQIDAIEATDPGNPENVKRGTADEWRWAVYGLGRRGKIKGAIYDHFFRKSFAEFPDKQACSFSGYGLDFGFSADPTALVEGRIHGSDLYVREVLYETGLIIQQNLNDPSVPSLEGRLGELGVSRTDLIVADSADPRSISALRLCGYSVVGVTKGPGSVLAGINRVKAHRIFVEDESLNLLTAFEQYKWRKLANGTQTRDPDHHMSDLMDALRYFVWFASPPKVSASPSRRMNMRAAKTGVAGRLARYRA